MTNWNDHEWVLRPSPRDHDPHGLIFNKSEKASNAFRFVPHANHGVVEYYTVEHAPGEMTAYWAPCRLFPRGLGESAIWRLDLLPLDRRDWQPKQASCLKDLQLSHTVNSRRLEGDFNFGGAAQAVTIWLVERAIVGEKPLLVVDVRDKTVGQDNESGSGTGDPR